MTHPLCLIGSTTERRRPGESIANHAGSQPAVAYWRRRRPVHTFPAKAGPASGRRPNEEVANGQTIPPAGCNRRLCERGSHARNRPPAPAARRNRGAAPRPHANRAGPGSATGTAGPPDRRLAHPGSRHVHRLQRPGGGCRPARRRQAHHL